MNHDRITTELVRHARGMKVRVFIDGASVGEVQPVYGWAPDLMDALDDGSLLTLEPDDQAARQGGAGQHARNVLKRQRPRPALDAEVNVGLAESFGQAAQSGRIRNQARQIGMPRSNRAVEFGTGRRA